MEMFSLAWALQESRKAEGFLRTGEEELLYKFALSRPRCTNVVEIGSWKGRSTTLLGSAIAASDSSGKVFAIDPHAKPSNENIKPQYDLWAEQKVYDTYQDFLDNIKRVELDKIIIPIRATSETAFAVREEYGVGQVGFLFIDGCHQRDYVEKDFDLWSQVVVEGGCIAFHDSNPNNVDYSEGPAIVAQTRLFDSGLYERCNRFKSLTYGYKK